MISLNGLILYCVGILLGLALTGVSDPSTLYFVVNFVVLSMRLAVIPGASSSRKLLVSMKIISSVPVRVMSFNIYVVSWHSRAACFQCLKFASSHCRADSRNIWIWCLRAMSTPRLPTTETDAVTSVVLNTIQWGTYSLADRDRERARSTPLACDDEPPLG
jgi:hypothetical protein